MKYQSSFVATVALAQYASAFPHMGLPAQDRPMPVPVEKRASAGSISGTDVPDAAQLAGTFDAKAQYVSNKGQYKWVAPGPSDQRGPCPGLNAMANHGYIPHNGVATLDVCFSLLVPPQIAHILTHVSNLSKEHSRSLVWVLTSALFSLCSAAPSTAI